MKINAINYYNFNNKSLNSNQDLKRQDDKELGLALISLPNYVSFQGRPAVNKIALVKENSKAVQSKIVKMFNMLPVGSKSYKPFLFTSGQHKYGMLIDKSINGEFKVVVKNMIDSNSDWTTPKRHQTSITCLFDNKGVMKQGELINNVNDNYSKRISYSIEGESRRRLKFDGMKFRPSHGENKNIWNRISDLSTNSAVEDMNFKSSMSDIDLSEVFFELTKNRASILK